MTLSKRRKREYEISSVEQSREVFPLIANALADPRRYEILRQIANQGTPLSFSSLCREHDIGASTMSYHLKLLAEARLIDVKRQGKRMTVALRADVVEQYLRGIERQLRLA